VGDLDLLVSVKDMSEAKPVMQYFTDFPGVDKVLGTGPTKTSVLLDDGMQLDLRVIPDEDFGTALHHFSGSKQHHIKLRELARQKHLTISEWGVFKLKPDGSQGDKLKVPDEVALYAALGLPFIAPEMREDTGEIEAAQAGKLPDLIEESDLKGITHSHTTFSDGHHTVEEMARAAAALGIKYLTITDHSQAASYAGGLTPDRLKAQWEEIDRVNELKLGVRLLKGTEVDILEDGTLDFPEAVLSQLEVVIGSIHSRFKMDEAQMTERISRAFDNPHLHIWGHATGRLIGEREPYAVRMEELLDKAARKGVAVEINGTPERLDLSSAHARLAKERGVELVLSTDAHSIAGLQNLRFAVGTARRAWIEKKDVLTRLDAPAFVKHLQKMRH
jgi:DNA polymerase (family 10)